MERKHYGAIDGLRTIACIGIMMMHVRANSGYEVSGFVYNTPTVSVFEFKKYMLKKSLSIPIATGVVFLLLSIWVYMIGIDHGVISFLLGLLACFSVLINFRH